MSSDRDESATHELVRFLPRATTVGMVVVIVLQVAGRLSPGASFLDIIVLFGIGIVARMILRSRTHEGRS